MSFQLGEKIRIIKNDKTRDDLWNVEGYVKHIHTDDYISVVLNHNIHGYPKDHEWEFSHAKNRIETISPVMVTKTTTRQEAPCQTCKRLNDLGVKVCWSCGNDPF